MRASRPLLVALALGSATTLTAACSSDDSASRQTIDITMVDNAFQPDRITVPRGEKVTLRFTNEGTVTHEALVGDDAAQMDHHEEMQDGSMSDPDEHGGGHGSSDDAVTVGPGEQRSMTVTVDEDEVLIGCHEPGHWEEGMKATMTTR